jgi:hypothetical protein
MPKTIAAITPTFSSTQELSETSSLKLKWFASKPPIANSSLHFSGTPLSYCQWQSTTKSGGLELHDREWSFSPSKFY